MPALLPLNLETAAAPEYDALFEALDREFGRLDGLAHVAGLLGDLSPIDQYDVPTWCKVLHVNLTAAFLVTQSLLPLLRRSEDAAIVFTSSTIARGGRAYWGAYAASKFGVEGLMQVLAQEMAGTTHIRVNSLNPGPVRTAMRRQAFPAEDPDRLPQPAAIVAPYLLPAGIRKPGRQRRGVRLPVTRIPAVSRSSFNSLVRQRTAASARKRAIHRDRPEPRSQDAIGFESASFENQPELARPEPRHLHLQPAIAAFTASGRHRRDFAFRRDGAGVFLEQRLDAGLIEPSTHAHAVVASKYPSRAG